MKHKIEEIIANAADQCNGRLQIKLEGFRCDDIIREAIAEAEQPLVALVEAAYKEGRDDGYDSLSATDEYNEVRWQQSKAKAALGKVEKQI